MSEAPHVIAPQHQPVPPLTSVPRLVLSVLAISRLHTSVSVRSTSIWTPDCRLFGGERERAVECGRRKTKIQVLSPTHTTRLRLGSLASRGLALGIRTCVRSTLYLSLTLSLSLLCALCACAKFTP